MINSRESGFSRILKSEEGYWVPETLVEQSKPRSMSVPRFGQKKNRTHDQALHHPSLLARKLKKDRTHDQALHHPSPLARKLKRIELMI
jgi:hypothetical protein